MTKNEALATKIIERALSNVKEKLEPLTYAVNILTPKAVGEQIKCVATDGSFLFFNAFQTIQYYERGEVSTIEYQIIHILLHGILGHFEDTAYVRKKLAWRVMDLSVEQILTQIGIRYQYFDGAKREYRTIGMGLYYQASTDKRMAQTILRQGKGREIDDHSYWWRKPAKRMEGSNGSGKEGFLSDSDEDVNKVAERWEKAKEYLLGKEAAGKNLNQISPRELCKALSQKLKGSGFGTESGEGSRCVQPEGEELSFREVFSEFLKSRCVSKDQPDFHDPMLYQYGLDIYGDIPLVEPLEEMEEVRLGNLVVAIDTSGSCEEFVGSFLAQLISIFKEIGTNFHFEKIYLIQCDSSIKNICEFVDVEELEEVKTSMKMYGFGGTSFAPVFRWIERNLIEMSESVDCLLYFSDAEGDFGMKEPEYPVFFIIPEDVKAEGVEMPIPDWIKKVYLGDSLEIKE